ncbi:hypothetical protein DFH09DRAFT_238227, partial [Mycena vulgaris]
ADRAPAIKHRISSARHLVLPLCLENISSSSSLPPPRRISTSGPKLSRLTASSSLSGNNPYNFHLLGGEVTHRYDTVMKGFAAKLNEKTLTSFNSLQAEANNPIDYIGRRRCHYTVNTASRFL